MENTTWRMWKVSSIIVQTLFIHKITKIQLSMASSQDYSTVTELLSATELTDHAQSKRVY